MHSYKNTYKLALNLSAEVCRSISSYINLFRLILTKFDQFWPFFTEFDLLQLYSTDFHGFWTIFNHIWLHLTGFQLILNNFLPVLTNLNQFWPHATDFNRFSTAFNTILTTFDMFVCMQNYSIRFNHIRYNSTNSIQTSDSMCLFSYC